MSRVEGMRQLRVHTLDSGYMGLAQFDAIYLIDMDGQGSQFALVDNATAPGFEALMQALLRFGIEPGDPRLAFLFVTHVHLDHAGATGQLAQVFPNAKVICHPKTARHLANPTRLIAGVKQVYGESEFERLYGTLLPVPESQIKSVTEGELLAGGANSQFEFWNLLGHATHHIGIFEKTSKSFFAGDSFGLCYPALQMGLSRPFIFPSTSPADFDPVTARQTVERIQKAAQQGQIERVYLTHYDVLDNSRDHLIEKMAQDLLRHLEFSAELMKKQIPAFDAAQEYTRQLHTYYQREFEALGGGWTSKVSSLLELDLKLNGQGIAFAAKPKN